MIEEASDNGALGSSICDRRDMESVVDVVNEVDPFVEAEVIVFLLSPDEALDILLPDKLEGIGTPMLTEEGSRLTDEILAGSSSFFLLCKSSCMSLGTRLFWSSIFLASSAMVVGGPLSSLLFCSFCCCCCCICERICI